METAKLVLNSLTDNLGDPPTTFFDLSSEDIMSVQSLEMIQATSILETTYKKINVEPIKEKNLKERKAMILLLSVSN